MPVGWCTGLGARGGGHQHPEGSHKMRREGGEGFLSEVKWTRLALLGAWEGTL